MADQQVSSTQCSVEIVTPEGVRLVFTPQDAVLDLLQVHTHNDLAEACGSFTLTFAPRRIEGRTYDQLIPMRSLVTIRLQDPARPVNNEDAVVMIGLTEDHGIQEDYSQARPQRLVTIAGRSIAALMLDARLFYHPGLETQGDIGILHASEAPGNDMRMFWDPLLVENQTDPRKVLGLILTYFLGVAGTEIQQTTMQLQTQDETQRVVTENPMATQSEAQSTARERVQTQRGAPRASAPTGTTHTGPESASAVDAFILQDMIAQTQSPNPRIAGRAQRLLAKTHPELVGAKAPAPVVAPPPAPVTASDPVPAPLRPPPPVPHSSNQLLNLQLPGRTIADLLVYREGEATLFDKDVTVPLGPDTAFAGAVWNYVKIFVDPLFQEIFTRMEGGVCRLHFRAKPFLQDYEGTGTRFRDDDPTVRTLELDQRIILASHLRRQSTAVYNFFRVLPRGITTSLKEKGPLYRLTPTILTDPAHPSYVRRYGIRVLDHASVYLSALPTIPSTAKNQTDDSVIAAGQRWGKIASVFYGYGAEMYGGVVTVLGSPLWNVGLRLLTKDERGPREGYIEGVDHQYDFRTGRYHSQLRVTRLWYLDGTIDNRGANAP